MIDLTIDTEQQLIIDSVQGVLARGFPIGAAACDPDTPDVRWQTMAELGWFGLGLPDRDGGAGFTIVEDSLLSRELGRNLQRPAVLATILAAKLCAESDAALCKRVLRGDCSIGFAMPIQPSAHGLLSGPIRLIDGKNAEFVIVLNAGRIVLLGTRDLNDRTSLPSMDGTILERAVLVDGWQSSGSRVGDDSIHLRLIILLAAQLVGIAEAARDMAVEYAKVRRQFGKPIGAFQAVAHQCADCALRSEAALAQLLFAGVALRDRRPDAVFEVYAAFETAANAAFENATINIQIHGAMGYSAECHAHLYLKRAHLLTQLAGDPRDRRAILLDAVGYDLSASPVPASA